MFASLEVGRIPGSQESQKNTLTKAQRFLKDIAYFTVLLASPISYEMDEAGSCCLPFTDEVPGVQSKAENLIQAHISQVTKTRLHKD